MGFWRWPAISDTSKWPTNVIGKGNIRRSSDGCNPTPHPCRSSPARAARMPDSRVSHQRATGQLGAWPTRVRDVGGGSEPAGQSRTENEGATICFERFTDRARRVVVLAQEEARDAQPQLHRH